MTENFNLAYAIWSHGVHTPKAIAIVHKGHQLSYAQLAHRASALADALTSASTWPVRGDKVPRVAILAGRGADACVAVAGTCWAGACYVPIDIRLPGARIVALLRAGMFDAVVADSEGEDLLTGKILAAAPALRIRLEQIVRPDPQASLSTLQRAPVLSAPVQTGPDTLACILFTSSTTDIPRGVMVTAGGVCRYLHAVALTLQLQPEDRVIDTSHISQDFSVHTMFSTWQAGATLYILPVTRVLDAVSFAREARLTVWNSPPSLAAMLAQIRTLSPASLPDLRLVVLGGEVLSPRLAAIWMEAAPHACLYKLYGPTEVPVFCMQQRVTLDNLAGSDPVPLGMPLPGTEAMVADARGRAVADGVPGELAIAGPQLARGYLEQPLSTGKRFPLLRKKRWHLTGDRVLRDASGVFHWLGRTDNRLKVHGHRVELEEVDAALRQVLGSDQVAAVGWPVAWGTADGIVGFVASLEFRLLPALAALRQLLPSYMVPDRILALQSIPRKRSGVPDRAALLLLLNQP